MEETHSQKSEEFLQNSDVIVFLFKISQKAEAEFSFQTNVLACLNYEELRRLTFKVGVLLLL